MESLHMLAVHLKLSLLCMSKGDEYVQILFYVDITNSSIL